MLNSLSLSLSLFPSCTPSLSLSLSFLLSFSLFPSTLLSSPSLIFLTYRVCFTLSLSFLSFLSRLVPKTSTFNCKIHPYHTIFFFFLQLMVCIFIMSVLSVVILVVIVDFHFSFLLFSFFFLLLDVLNPFICDNFHNSTFSPTDLS